MRDKLEEALNSLDTDNDDYWTSDGSPKLDILSSRIGEKVTRALVTSEFPLFTRDSAIADQVVEPEPESEEDMLFRAVETAEEILMNARRLVDETMTHLSESQESYEIALKAHDDAHPPLTNTQNIREFLNEQQRQRISRGSYADAFIRKQDAAHLAKSKIDQAFVSKKRFGSRRPVHPRVAKQG